MASDTLERLEKKGELGDLIEFVGRPVYQDPLIRVLIDHAPSSKAIEKHMTDVLGWGNDLAERARAALKLRKDHPERWEELGTSMIAPADISFEFDPG
ncbi:hypothetical protein HY523_01800, partial [Candidatus Berkelbacteria bacterium]|nr:hypothetical protein [Candidatus Berkelbacteria bacterium]